MTPALAPVALALALAPTPRVPTDADGDPLPDGVVARFGTTRFRQTDGPRGWLFFTPDGAAVVACGASAARVFDRATGRLVRTLEPGPGAVDDADLGPDGRTLNTLHGRRVVASDIASGRSTVFWPGEVGTLPDKFLRVSADGRTVAVAEADGTTTRSAGPVGYVRLLAAATGREVFASEPLGDKLVGLAVSADGRRVAVGRYENGFAVVDVPSGVEVLRAKRQGTWVRAAFAPGGDRLAVTAVRHEGGRVEVWDVRTGKPTVPPQPAFNYVRRVAFSPDGAEVWCLDKTGAVALDAAGVKPARSLGRAGPVGVVAEAVSRDGKWSAGWDGSCVVRVWDTATGTECGPPADVWVEAVPSPDGSKVATLGPAAVAVWDAATGRRLVRVGGDDFGGELRWTADGKDVTARQGGAVGWWDAATGRRVRTLTLPHRSWHRVSVRGDDVSAAPRRGTQADDRRLGRDTRGEWVGRHGPDAYEDGWENHLAPDGGRYVTEINEPGRQDVGYGLYDAGGGLVARLAVSRERPALAFSPDGRRIVGVIRGRVRAWDAATGDPVGRPGPADAALANGCGTWLAVSSDGRTAAVEVPVIGPVSGDGPVDARDGAELSRTAVRLYDTATGRFVAEVGRFDHVDRFLFVPGTRRLVVVRHGYAEVVEPPR